MERDRSHYCTHPVQWPAVDVGGGDGGVTGDPAAKGERLPAWMKAVVERAVGDDRTYAYAPTKGDLEARHFIIEHYSDPRVCTVDEIIFFNGLGEAINKIFSNLPATARVIGPNPTYPSHATAEAMHHGGHHLTYRLDLDRGGRIDVADLERMVAGDEHIVGILVINPNNPLGVVHPREDLEAVVRIAREHHCFLIFDEIYQHLAFDPSSVTRLADIVGDVPAISMKGVSKEIPWPGSRCGWIEVYNGTRDANFRGYVNTIVISGGTFFFTQVSTAWSKTFSVTGGSGTFTHGHTY